MTHGYRIISLTLTAYNSKYSILPFLEKKMMHHGFEYSGIGMNMMIAKKEKWTLVELEERSQYLTKRALQIWQPLTTSFQPAKKPMDKYTLEDDILVLAGRKPAAFRYKKSEQPVKSLVELYERMLQLLYVEDQSIIRNLAI